MTEVPASLGRYRLEQQLGQGATAVVWKAFDPSTDRYVAVKILKPAYELDPDYRTRFLREARAAGALQHPNIVQLFDVTDETGAPAIIMELVDGPSLADLVERQGALAPADVRRLLLQLARAVGFAHARGRVHRDLKPSNILLTADLGTAKVADFGIAQITQDATQLTQVGQLVGTPRYMAPEQLEGGRRAPAP